MDSLGTLAYVLDWIIRIGSVAALAGTLGRSAYKRHQRRVIERFFGGTSVTTYFPLRCLENRTVIAEADFVAAHEISAFLAKYRIQVTFKFIGPDGRFDLTEPGVVAICGPKSSAMAKRALDLDETVRFQEDDNSNYTLVDQINQQRYGSLRDCKDDDGDVGYLARNHVAPGSKVTFISIAGIHAEGSAIVVSHLCNYGNLRAIYRATKDSLFSSIIGGLYRTDPLVVTTSKRLVLHSRAPAPTKANDVAEVSTIE